MRLLVQNKKMRKSSNENIIIYNWTLPAYKALNGDITCPNASKCIKGCYARQGAYIWSNVSKAHNLKYKLSLQTNFADLISNELSKIKTKKQVYIRIHDAGDFYSLDYLLKWVDIIQRFPRIKFYAYTKQIQLFNWVLDLLPSNFTVIYSYGGKQDQLINRSKHRHAIVFSQSIPSNYADATNNDLIALGPNKCIGLVYHGAKSYENTTWAGARP